MNTGIIIQARTKSTRLLNKILLDFYEGRSILELLVSRIREGLPEYKLVLATSINPEDDILENLCRQWQIDFYRGSEENVLERFIGAAKLFKFSSVIRVCADNPFIMARYIKELIEFGEKDSSADYVGFAMINGKPSIKTHIGLFGEWVKTITLEKVIAATSGKNDLEHVTSYIYEHPELFQIKLLNAPKEIFDKLHLRFTVDTIDDFHTARKIYEMLPDKGYWKISDLVEIAESNSGILSSMQKEIEKNEK